MASSSSPVRTSRTVTRRPPAVGPGHRRRRVVGELQVDGAELAGLGVHRLELAVRAHVAIQVVLVDRRVARGELDGRGDRGRAAVAGAVLVGAGLAGRLAAADAVDVGDAADRPTVVDQRSVGRVDERLELGQGHDPVDAVAVLADLRAVGVDAGGHDDRADLDRERLGVRPADPDADLVVPEAAGLADHLGFGEDADRRSLADRPRRVRR